MSVYRNFQTGCFSVDIQDKYDIISYDTPVIMVTATIKLIQE